MKFFYINNSLCEGCDDCSLGCPSGAVYSSVGKRFIIHDKCTSCGICLRSCGHSAVSIESIDAMVERMENADLYLSRIRRLEQELAQLKERYEDAERDMNTVMENYPSAAAILDKESTIFLTNRLFDELTSGLTTASLTGLIRSAVTGIQTPTGEILGHNYSVHSVRLSGSRNLLIIDHLALPAILVGRVAEALDIAVRRQMETVRKIGTILGDETSLTLNDINRAVSLLRLSDPGGEVQIPVDDN